MPFSFPSSPSVGQQSTQNGRAYSWSGYAWELVAPSGGLSWSSVPASATASGTAGAIAYDGEFLYVATATNTWERVALSTWVVPVITIGTQPSNQTASSGAATFSVSASVTQSAALSYQWQRSTNSGSTWANVSGATSSSLALTGLVSGDNGYQYRVVVSATGGATSVNSSAATLTVSSKVFSSVTALQGGTVSGEGTGTLTFTRTASSGQFIVRFTIPAGTLTVAKPSGGNFSGSLWSATNMAVPGQVFNEDEFEYWFAFPSNANSASQNLPGLTARWEQTGSVGDIPNGSAITFTIV
jgi:hypothetical protein